MKVFPQLGTGAVAQFPFRSRVESRTLINELYDGSEIRFRDLAHDVKRWELQYEDLSDDEFVRIQNLFEECEGRLGDFVFLEPGRNLLRWSESLEQESWVGSGITVMTGLADPFGGTGGGRIDGVGTLRQTVAAPGSTVLTGSVWARTSTTGSGLRIADGTGFESSRAFDADFEWRRYTVNYPGGSSSSEQTSFELFASGSPTEVFGPQLEAQPAAGGYNGTSSSGGVHVGARFDQDVLEDRVVGVGRHSGVVRIQWQPSQS